MRRKPDPRAWLRRARTSLAAARRHLDLDRHDMLILGGLAISMWGWWLADPSLGLRITGYLIVVFGLIRTR